MKTARLSARSPNPAGRPFDNSPGHSEASPATERLDRPSPRPVPNPAGRPVDNSPGRSKASPAVRPVTERLERPSAPPILNQIQNPKSKIKNRLGLLFLLLILLFTTSLHGETTNAPVPLPVTLNIGFNNASQPPDIDVAIQVLFAITLLSLAPSIILLMTCFLRIAVVLSFVRTALSLQSTPANQVIVGLSLFLTLFIMAPTWERIDAEALSPYRAKQITSGEALARASIPIRAFMLRQTRPKDVELFAALAKLEPASPDKLPLKVVVPGFIISELRTAFQMGFLLFVPFILIDLVVATVLMSMGMMMMPPVTVSLPLKILLFVLVDGWNLVVRSVVLSFGG